eukprot:403489_1
MNDITSNDIIEELQKFGYQRDVIINAMNQINDKNDINEIIQKIEKQQEINQNLALVNPPIVTVNKFRTHRDLIKQKLSSKQRMPFQQLISRNVHPGLNDELNEKKPMERSTELFMSTISERLQEMVLVG